MLVLINQQVGFRDGKIICLNLTSYLSDDLKCSIYPLIIKNGKMFNSLHTHVLFFYVSSLSCRSVYLKSWAHFSDLKTVGWSFYFIKWKLYQMWLSISRSLTASDTHTQRRTWSALSIECVAVVCTTRIQLQKKMFYACSVFLQLFSL